MKDFIARNKAGFVEYAKYVGIGCAAVATLVVGTALIGALASE